MQTTYATKIKDPWNILRPLINVENISSFVSTTSTASSAESFVKRASDASGGQDQSLFQSLTGSATATSSAALGMTSGLQKIILYRLPSSVIDMKAWASNYVSVFLKQALNSSYIQEVNTSMLEEILPISTRQLYLGARNTVVTCTDTYLVTKLQDMLVYATFGFGSRALSALAADPQSTAIFEMSTPERNELIARALLAASNETFQTCQVDLKYALSNTTACLSKGTINTLVYEDPAWLSYSNGNKSTDYKKRIQNTVDDLQSNITVALNLVYGQSNVIQGICSNVQRRFQQILLQYGQEYLSDFNNLLISQIEELLNDEATQQLLHRISGINSQDFKNLLLYTDPRDGVTRLGSLLGTVRDLVIGSDTEVTVAQTSTTSVANAQLGVVATKVNQRLEKLDVIIQMTFNGLLGKCAGLLCALDLCYLDLCYLDFITWIASLGFLCNYLGLYYLVCITWLVLLGLCHLYNFLYLRLCYICPASDRLHFLAFCTAGFSVSLVALIVIYWMIALFAMNVYTLGYFQHQSIVKLFDPVRGYVPSLKKNYNGNGDDNDGGAGSEKAVAFGLVDLFAMLGREPKRKETMLLNELNAAHAIKDEAEIQVVQHKIQIHIAESLQYRSVLSSPSFLATYLYMQMFGYLIYFAMGMVLFALPFQEIFWIAVGRYYYLWLPIVLIIVVKVIVQILLVKRLEMDKGQYRGIPHPR